MTDHREADRREDALTPDERIRHLTLVVRWARTRHAKAVETLSNEVEDLDEFGRTLDRAIAERVAAEAEAWKP